MAAALAQVTSPELAPPAPVLKAAGQAAISLPFEPPSGTWSKPIQVVQSVASPTSAQQEGTAPLGRLVFAPRVTVLLRPQPGTTTLAKGGEQGRETLLVGLLGMPPIGKTPLEMSPSE